jgi:hypothetical protein
VKICRFGSAKWFFCIKIVQLGMAGKRRNTMVHLQKRCNIWDLIAAQYFLLIDHNDWFRWFAISSPRVSAIPVTVLLEGLQRKTAKIRHFIFLSRVTYGAPVWML